MKKTNRLVTIFLMVCMVLASGGLLYATMYASGAGTQSTQTTVAFDAPSGIRYNELTGAFEVFSGVGVSWIGSNGWISTLGEYDKSTSSSPPQTGTAGVWYQATRTSTYNIMCDISYSSVFQPTTTTFVPAYNEAFDNGITLEAGGKIYGRGFFLKGFPVRNADKSSALIAVNNGIIRNVNIIDAHFNNVQFGTGSATRISAGILCAVNGSDGLIDDCGVYGVYSTDKFTNLYGIAGENSGTIMNSSNNAKLINSAGGVTYTAGITEILADSNTVNNTNNGSIVGRTPYSGAAGIAMCKADIEGILAGNVNNAVVTAIDTASGIIGGSEDLDTLQMSNNTSNGELFARETFSESLGKIKTKPNAGEMPVTGIRWNPDLYLFEMYNTAGVSYIASGFWISPQGLISNVAMEGYKQADSFSTYRLMNDVEYDDTEPYFNENFKDVTKAPLGRGPVIQVGGIVDGGGHTLYYFPTRYVGLFNNTNAGESAFLMASTGVVQDLGFITPSMGSTLNTYFSGYLSAVNEGKWSGIMLGGTLRAGSSAVKAFGAVGAGWAMTTNSYLSGVGRTNNCIIKNVVSVLNIVNNYGPAGLGGTYMSQGNTLTIENVFNFGNVEAATRAGSIIGNAYTDTSGHIKINSCSNYGTIESTAAVDNTSGLGAGGILPAFYWRTESYIRNCINRGEVIAKNSTAGGIVANVYATSSSADISGHQNYGNVTGKTISDAGAIVGWSSSAADTKIKNCYNTGGVGPLGGLVYGTAVRFLGNSSTLYLHNGSDLISEDIRPPQPE